MVSSLSATSNDNSASKHSCLGCSPNISQAFERRAVDSSPLSKACFNLIRGWMSRCLFNHQDICSRPPAAFPSRLLDVGPPTSLDSVLCLRVMDSAEAGPWVALSHCWGTRSDYFKTTTANFQDRQSKIAFDSLPATFQDAVVVTRKLGFQYIWIDSLCILQDDYEDWVHEASRMHEYYRDSTLTIAADCAAGDEEGFLYQERPDVSVVTRFPLRGKASSTECESSSLPENKLDFMFMRKSRQKLTNEKQPLHTRAWTLQEHILSPRTVHYTSHELRWTCQTLVSSESHRSSDSRDMKHHFLVPTQKNYQSSAPWSMNGSILSWEDNDSSYLHWYGILEDYIHRKLTLASDKLPAISGLAREVYLQTHSKYKAGIWMEDIHRGLLWAFYARGQLPEAYRAPSWSWASLDVAPGIPVHDKFLALYQGDIAPERPMPDSSGHLQAEILECETTALSIDIFGQVASGRITLRSYWISWTRGKTEGKSRMWPNRPTMERFFRQPVFDQAPMVFNFDQYYELCDENNQFSNLSIVQILKFDRRIPDVQYGLLLRPAETPGCFRRVGRVKLIGHGDLSEGGWEMKTITIV
jgi:hypothetical protein